jgi:choline dehydrogenase-like flavoprotein
MISLSDLSTRTRRLLVGSAQRFLFPSEPQMRRLHDSLCDLFGPGREVKLPDCVSGELANARERLWRAVQETEKVQWLLVILANLPLLQSRLLYELYNRYIAKIPNETRAAQLATFEQLKREVYGLKSNGRSFADLSPVIQEGLLNFLLRSPLNFHRRIGSSLRIFYLRGIYEGRTGRLVAGIDNHGSELMKATPNLSAPPFATSLRYDPATRTMATELDYIIIGSGPAGAVVAHEFQRAGKKILLLEAGPFFLPGTFDARAGLDFYEDRGYRTTTDGGIFVLNGWVVGGGSTINADMVFSPSFPSVRHRIEQWRKAGKIPPDLWLPAEMDRADRWVASHLGTRTVHESEINEHNKVLKLGALNHGLKPMHYQLNTFAPGESPLPKTDKRDAVGGFLMKILTAKDNPVTLVPDALVSRVLIENGRARGVSFTVRGASPRAGILRDPFRLAIPDGVAVKAFARHVVVAGGTLGSSVLLLNSGVRNPNIGAGFVMHPFCLVLGQFDREINCHLGTSSSVYVGDYLTSNSTGQMPDFLVECASARPEIGALMLPGNGFQVYEALGRYRYTAGIGILLLDSVHEDNRVKVSAGEAQISYTLSEADKRRFRRGVAEGVSIMFKAGANKVIVPTHENILGDADGATQLPFLTHIEQADLVEQRLNFHSNQTTLFAAHMMAGNKIGPSPDVSVVSNDYEVWGVKNLFVVDGSIFPGSIGANPMQSIYAIAKIFADRHLAQ